MKQVADRKQCSACRYSQCLRAGMRTDLILDEEEKKTRFRKALEKKQASLEAASSKVESGEEEGKMVPGNLVEVKQEASSPSSQPSTLAMQSQQGGWEPASIPLSPPLQAPRRHFLPRGRTINTPSSPFQIPPSPRPSPSPRMMSPRSPQSPISPLGTQHIMNPFSPQSHNNSQQQSRVSPFPPGHNNQQPSPSQQPFSPGLHLAPTSPPTSATFSSHTSLTRVLSPTSAAPHHLNTNSVGTLSTSAA